MPGYSGCIDRDESHMHYFVLYPRQGFPSTHPVLLLSKVDDRRAIGAAAYFIKISIAFICGDDPLAGFVFEQDAFVKDSACFGCEVAVTFIDHFDPISLDEYRHLLAHGLAAPLGKGDCKAIAAICRDF